LHYLEWHEASLSDRLASVFLEYVRFETPLPSYLSGIAPKGLAAPLNPASGGSLETCV